MQQVVRDDSLRLHIVVNETRNKQKARCREWRICRIGCWFLKFHIGVNMSNCCESDPTIPFIQSTTCFGVHFVIGSIACIPRKLSKTTITNRYYKILLSVAYDCQFIIKLPLLLCGAAVCLSVILFTLARILSALSD